MSQSTTIEWTDATWNPIRGCSRVSEGCRNCYAERVAARFSGPGKPYEGLAVMKSDGPHWTGKVELVREHLEDPLRWKKPRRIFVNSMSDLFHESVPQEWIAEIFNVMFRASWHTYQVLTKRPKRMLEIMRDLTEHSTIFAGQPLHHVWPGVSVEDQETADERISLLLETPAAVRWVSYEPALGPVDFRKIRGRNQCDFDVLHGRNLWNGRIETKLNWLVCGGESGPGARPMHPAWARSVRDQCIATGVPFFFKQWGEWCPWRDRGNQHYQTDGPSAVSRNGRRIVYEGFDHIGKKKAGRLLDGREWKEYPL